MFAVISCSLNPQSHSALFANYAYKKIHESDFDAIWIDLRDYQLPICNGIGQSAYNNDQVKKLHDILLPVKGIIIASPIHNWGIAATTKNLIELLGTGYSEKLTGNVFRNKTIGFIGAAGTIKSFLAPIPFLNSMYMDFKSVIVPPYVIGVSSDIDNQNNLSRDIMSRINEMVEKFKLLVKCNY